MNEICPSAQCTGCAACAQQCAHGAITMRMAANGFLYPKIDKDACTDCGLCKKTCPVNDKPLCGSPLNVYLCWNKNDRVRLRSSSGGLFSVIASWIISKGGIVCGAAYDGDMNVVHQVVDREDGLGRLRGSKYVQSATGDCYKRIKDALRTGRQAYFVGTPCQVAGLRAYLQEIKTDDSQLYCCDLVCHGVPSPAIWKNYIVVAL